MKFDVVVVGGGHAGTEAAAASARLGAKTALVTHRFATIGAMSCNPAIGGLGKGHLVREIDALDGLMGKVADDSGIQFRMLNRRKGAAVRGPRTQSDRKLYRQAMQHQIMSQQNLEVIEGEAHSLLFTDGNVSGLALGDGKTIFCGAVVVTTGTFLNGLIHIGDRKIPAGRINEAPSTGLTESFMALGLRLGRLKTGTPARLNGRTIDWGNIDLQYADDDPTPFSFMTDKIRQHQIACGITRTTDTTHNIIRDNIGRSAMYSGQISGVGPRYCPSIEDKIVRFGDRDGHQIFLEPEGLDDDTVYPNGISTSLPEDVQTSFIRSIPGLERVEILQVGYAIEYDHVDPTELDRALQTKKMKGLFLAGQINGTTGYEEAAAQGLVAGLNAALVASGSKPYYFSRTDSYLGVMIDDLTSRGIEEPYRMFTSRAEYRLTLRADNADMRLTELGQQIGIVGSARFGRFREYASSCDVLRAELKGKILSPNEASKYGLRLNMDGQRRSVYELLAYPDIDLERVLDIWPEFSIFDRRVLNAIEIEAKYAVYVERQNADIREVRRDEDRAIPHDFSYDSLSGLSNELKVKLMRHKPANIAQAARIDGMTPAALTLLLVAVRKAEPSPITTDVQQLSA